MRVLARFGALIIASALLGIGPGAGADDGGDKAGKKVRKTRICKRVKVTGTHFAKRVCRTQAQWDEMKAQNERDMERVMTSNPHEIPLDGGAPPI